MKDKFYITNLIKNLINDFDKYLINFPHKDIELKKEIMTTSYHMLKLTYEANATYDMNKRINIIEKVIAYIKYLDYLVNLCCDKMIINSKKYLRFGNDLNYLLKYVISWHKVSINVSR